VRASRTRTRTSRRTRTRTHKITCTHAHAHAHARAHAQEVVMFGRTASAMSHLSFKGKSLETGQMINRIPSTNSSSFNRIESSQSSLSFNRIASDQSLGGIVEEGAAPKENEEATGETN